MSNIFYAERLFWDSHTNRGCAKHHGHEVRIDAAPCICGRRVNLDFTPEIGVGRIQYEFEGWVDMSHDEIIAADKLLHDLLPD